MTRRFRSQSGWALAFAPVALTALIAACSAGDGSQPKQATAAPTPPQDPLLYEQKKYFIGLDEWVVIHKGSDGVWCRRADGRIQDCEEVRAEERRVYFAKYGEMDKDFADLVRSAPPDQEIPAFVLFKVRQTPEMHSSDPAINAAAQAEFKSRVHRGFQEWWAWLESEGISMPDIPNVSMPMFEMTARPSVYMKMAWSSKLALIAYASKPRPGSYGTADSGPTDGVLFNDVLNLYNYSGYEASGVKVGVLGIAGGCRLWSEHQAFERATVIESHPAQSCNFDFECDTACGGVTGGSGGACKNHECVDLHETGVASVISVGRDDTTYGAAQATLLHWNHHGPGTTAACERQELTNAYEWFSTNGARIVNESFFCDDNHVDGLVQDYYAKAHGMLILRAGGNEAANQEVACPYNLNSLCVGAVDHAGVVSCISDMVNPPSSDREEPDLLALGGHASSCPGADGYSHGVEIARADSGATTTTWGRSQGGTSFSAPQVAQMAALYQEKCGVTDGLAMRALFMVGSYTNADAEPYSTPGLTNPAQDYRDGAGILKAFDCASGGDSGVSVMDIDLTGGHPAPYDARCVDCGSPLSLRPQNSSRPWGTSDGRVYQRVMGIAPGHPRLRATLSWNSCATGTETVAPIPIATDFDLFLVDEDGYRVLYSSQSNDDNNEGFDVDLTKYGTSSTYEVYVGWPRGAPGCDGVTNEHTAFAWTVWP